MHTLVEAAGQLEGSSHDEEGDELDKVVCPECGEISYQSGYKVIVQEFGAQKPAQATEKEKEAPVVELKGEDEPEFEMIHDLEFGEDDKLQSQPTRDIEFT